MSESDATPLLAVRAAYRSTHGYLAMTDPGQAPQLRTTTDDYATEQLGYQPEKTRRYLIPILKQCGARIVVDVGCGIGAMVQTLLENGFDAYGVDVADVEPRWAMSGSCGLSRRRFLIIDPQRFALPFGEASVDVIYSFGVLEHVGTADGHSLRLADYHEIRRAWIRELFRTVKIGGHLLLGGPNRNFPIDAAHGPDAAASRLEHWLWRQTGLSIHRTWGQHFLWGYGDLVEYLEGLHCEIAPLSVEHYIDHSRAPASLRGIARAYLHCLPRSLLGTGFNPWMMALVTRRA